MVEVVGPAQSLHPSKNIFLLLMLSKKVGARKISRIRESKVHTTQEMYKQVTIFTDLASQDVI